MSELNDKELFEQAIADAPVEIVAEAPAQEPVAEATDGVVRDEKGRFAPKEPEQPAVEQVQAKPETAKQDEANVPSWRLREVNEAREAAERRAQEASDRATAYERQLAQLQQQQQKPQEIPNVFENPEGWQSFVLNQTRQTAASQRYEFSEMLARQAFGDERVTDAEKWASVNVGPAEKARIANSKHPYAELIRLMDERKVLSEIGTDPNAYVQKKLDEALNNSEFLAKAAERIRSQANGTQPGQKPTNLVQLPPSINRATAAASPHDETGDLSDRSLYAYATR